jgi:asparagine N-glycosylation enzyme membrane subunit Stt3
MMGLSWRASGFIRPRHSYYAGQAVTQTRKAMIWFVLAALAALVSYWSFRGYLAAEFLIGFANSLYC